MEILTQDQSVGQRIEAATSKLRGQPKRILWHLHNYGPTHTGELCQATATQNLSSAASIANEALKPYGLVIVATLPEKLLVNRFGEKSMSHLWSLQAIR